MRIEVEWDNATYKLFTVYHSEEEGCWKSIMMLRLSPETERMRLCPHGHGKGPTAQEAVDAAIRETHVEHARRQAICEMSFSCEQLKAARPKVNLSLDLDLSDL